MNATTSLTRAERARRRYAYLDGLADRLERDGLNHGAHRVRDAAIRTRVLPSAAEYLRGLGLVAEADRVAELAQR